MRSPWQWSGLALVMVAGLAAWETMQPPLALAPADAWRHEGQRVRMTGLVASVEDQGFVLASDGAAVRVLQADPAVVAGEAVEVTGRIGRLDGRIVLYAQVVAPA